MTIDDQFKDEKLQYDINKEDAKILALSSDKINKYEYLTSEAKFTYYHLGKAFEKQTKTIEHHGEKQVDPLKSLESSEKQLLSIKDFISK